MVGPGIKVLAVLALVDMESGAARLAALRDR
jgi:hypothetical protein